MIVAKATIEYYQRVQLVRPTNVIRNVGHVTSCDWQLFGQGHIQFERNVIEVLRCAATLRRNWNTTNIIIC